LLKGRQLAAFEGWRSLKDLAALAASKNTHNFGGLWPFHAAAAKPPGSAAGDSLSRTSWKRWPVES
jgi:hypothetical protein